MDCSVCGFSLDGPCVCPACGSENQSAMTDGGNIEKEPIAKIENVEVSNGENMKGTPHEPTDLSMTKTPILPFDIDDAPPHSGDKILPYGLEYAPFDPNN